LSDDICAHIPVGGIIVNHEVVHQLHASHSIASGQSRHVDKGADAANTAGYYLIGDLARDFGVTLRALRFYEDKGLLRPGRRGAVRLYSDRDRERLAIILKGKQLGFTLGEIAGMIERNEGDFNSASNGLTLRLSVDQISEQIRHLEAQKRDIEAAITELEASRAHVARLKL